MSIFREKFTEKMSMDTLNMIMCIIFKYFMFSCLRGIYTMYTHSHAPFQDSYVKNRLDCVGVIIIVLHRRPFFGLILNATCVGRFRMKKKQQWKSYGP